MEEHVRREIVLTPATERDVPFIVGLLDENNLPSADIPDKWGALFLARSEETVVGIGGVEILGRYGLLRSLAVVRDLRGRGYGRAVTGGLLDHARRKGVTEIYLLTMTAAAFFEGLGFTRVQRESAPPPIASTSEFCGL